MKKATKWKIQRYKGLGEMNPDELKKETTMDQKNRTLRQVDIATAEEADKVFEMLMGSRSWPLANPSFRHTPTLLI